MEIKKSSLGLKFSLTIGIILFLFCALFSTILYYYLKKQIIQKTEEKTLIIMTHVEAVGAYVRETLRPTIFSTLHRLDAQGEFIVEAMSTTHVSLQVMERFNKELRGYIYKRVSANPMNPKNKADSFHIDMINHFRHYRNQAEWKGIVDIDGKKHLVRLSPVIMEKSCLQCHGNPSDAPKELLKVYGTKGGFGRRVGDVIGVNSVMAPLDLELANIRKAAVDTFMFGFSTLGILFLIIYGTFRYVVIKPIGNLSITFKEIAGGKKPLGIDIPINQRDEIGDLIQSFNILSRHLLDAQERLKKTAEIEKQMMETEKLATIGQLAAGVAHEINNPLGGIKLCFNNLMTTKMDGDKKMRHIEVINSGFNRIQNIVKQLLDYSKNVPLIIAPSTVNKIIEDVLSLVEYTISKKRIILIKDFSDKMPEIMADSNKLEQIFLNLIINAIQAMSDGGALTIRTWSEDNFCNVSVSDTGKGIPTDILNKIFDPFFTTKEIGEGTGLGLTVSKSIVDQHRGEITVGTSDKGTTFTVKLPVTS